MAVHSKKKTIDENIQQVVGYTGYLLFARPDRVAMLGLYISTTEYAIILMDPTGTYRTEPLVIDNNISLLRRALHYINKPPQSMIDPTIIREAGNTFEITIEGKPYKGCKQRWAPTLRRRTTVFTTGDETVRVIKEQYLRPSGTSQVTEGEILRKIHSRGQIPGVVRVGWSGLVKREDGSCVKCGNGGRQKVRLELKDEGDLFMTIKTPYDALVVIWDVLEGATFTSISNFTTDIQS